MKTPDEQQLAGSKPYCLDTEWMLQHFLGKSKEEAIELFKSTGGVSECFAYMSQQGLLFYLDAALEYLSGDDSEDDEWGFAPGLLCSLASKVKYESLGRNTLIRMVEVADYCSRNTEKFELSASSADHIDIIKAEQSAVE